MKCIQSRENPTYKALRRLEAAGARQGADALLDGLHLCETWLAQEGAPVWALFDASRLAEPALAALAARLPSDVCLALEPALLAGLASVPSGQGVIFQVSLRRHVLPERLAGASLWLDRVQDPGNVGTLLRTAAAAGIHDVVLSEGCAAAWSAKALRSGQGAHFALRIHERAALLDLVPRLSVPLIATALHDSESLYEADLPRDCVWVFGHEGQGVAPALLAAAHLRLRIPHEPVVESLNVGIAAAICLFEHRRRYP